MDSDTFSPEAEFKPLEFLTLPQFRPADHLEVNHDNKSKPIKTLLVLIVKLS